MKTSQNRPTCENVQLDMLLFGDENSDEYRQTAGHVESCPQCQARLSTLAAEDDDWTEICTQLQPSPHDGLTELPNQPRVKLDFLSAPSHPEMLGRLGRYEIERVIGAGGMGIVLKGFDTELNRPVAIKVLAPHLAHNGPARQRFAREARAAASIVHEHVVAIHDVQSDQEAPFLVMPYVSGQSLQERVERDGPLSACEILRIGMQAAAGLAAAHDQGVIHRDVKPANILLENNVERAMLTDFGLARAADDATLTHSGIIAGTPHYMSPEQARGGSIDARSDLFGLGAVLYFMAAGHPPFRAEQAMAILHRICHDRHRPVQEINPTIPDELSDVIDRLLEKKTARRFASAGEVQQSLAQALAHIQQPPGQTRRWLRSLRLRKRQLLTSAVVLLSVVGAGWLALRIVPTTGPSGTSDAQSVHTTVSDPKLVRLRSEQDAYVDETAAISHSLARIENSTPLALSGTGAANDGWRFEATAADRAAARLEKDWSRDPLIRSSLNSVEGVEP